MANVVYNSFKVNSMTGVFNLSTDTLKVALVAGGYNPDIDAHVSYADIVPYEVSGVGYTTEGQTLAGVTVTNDLVNDRSVLDANDVSWVSSTITATGAVIYKVNGSPSSSPLIGYIDFSGPKSSSNGDFVIQWNASGILTLQ